MPFLLIPLLFVGGAFVGSQVDNAVQSAAAKPVIVDNSKMPWYVTIGIWAVIGLVAWHFIKKEI